MLRDLATELTLLFSQLDAQNAIVAERTRERDDARAQVAAARDELALANEKLAEAENHHVRLRDQLSALVGDRNQLIGRLAEAERQFAATRAELAVWRPRPLIGAKLDGNEAAQMLASRDRYTAFVGRAPQLANVFLSLEAWSTPQKKFLAADYWAPRAVKLGVPILWTVGLCPKPLVAGANVLQRDVLTGAKDAEFLTCFRELRKLPASARLHGRIPVRIGHEANVKRSAWYEWSDDPATYIPALQRVVDLARSVGPDFLFVWCVNACSDDIARWYPGELCVDVVSFDYYYQRQETFTAARDHATAGFDRIIKFALEHGHDVAIDELGAVKDSGAWLDEMAAWARLQPFKWICWWDSTAHINTAISSGQGGTTGERYRAHFGQAS